MELHTRDRCSVELELGHASASLSCATDRVYRELVEVRAANDELVARRNRGGLAHALLGRVLPSSDHLADSLTRQLAAFCAFVREGEQSQLATAADGVAVMDAIDAARRSHALGGAWVEAPAPARPALR
jgi:predicted dehydrogenase